MSVLQQPVELRLKLFGDSFTIAAQAWGDIGGHRVLAYPGWLDNAGSFRHLGAELAALGFYVVAIDPPGCGHSSHLPPFQLYNDFDEVLFVFEIADALGFGEFFLMGHSRGGGIAVAAAATVPDRILGMVLYDSWMSLNTGSLVGATVEVQPASTLIREAFQTALRNRSRSSRVFLSYEEAVEHSMTNPWFPKLRHTAVAIVDRHLTPVPDNPGTYIFTHDPRTYGQRQMVHATNEMILDYCKAIECPVLLVEAERKSEMRELLNDVIQERINAVRRLTRVTIRGNHHVHSDEAQAVAKLVERWWRSTFPTLRLAKNATQANL